MRRGLRWICPKTDYGHVDRLYLYDRHSWRRRYCRRCGRRQWGRRPNHRNGILLRTRGDVAGIMLLNRPVIGHGNKVGAGNIDRLNTIGDSERLQTDVAPAWMAAKADEAIVDDGVLASRDGHDAGYPVLAVQPHAAERRRGMVLNPDSRR